MHISHHTIGDWQSRIAHHPGLHTNAATPAVEIPAIPSQIPILSQPRLQVTSKKADAVKVIRNVAKSRKPFFAGSTMC